MAQEITNKPLSITPVEKITSLPVRLSDLFYWQSPPYEERVAALEELRSVGYQWEFSAQPGIQREFIIIKR